MLMLIDNIMSFCFVFIASKCAALLCPDMIRIYTPFISGLSRTGRLVAFNIFKPSSVIYFALQLSRHLSVISVCIFISFLQADGTDLNLFLQQ